MNTSTINQIFSKLSKAIPAPQSDLQYVNHYTLLVAVVLSAQSTDAQVNKATKDLFAKYDTPEKILKLDSWFQIQLLRRIEINCKSKNEINDVNHHCKFKISYSKIKKFITYRLGSDKLKKLSKLYNYIFIDYKETQ